LPQTGPGYCTVKADAKVLLFPIGVLTVAVFTPSSAVAETVIVAVTEVEIDVMPLMGQPPPKLHEVVIAVAPVRFVPFRVIVPLVPLV
jgi:hypothetical protein